MVVLCAMWIHPEQTLLVIRKSVVVYVIPVGKLSPTKGRAVCVCACVRACVRVCVCVMWIHLGSALS